MLDVAIENFAYPSASEIIVLQDISFSLNTGEHLVLLGESGCGKSTLLHLVYGLFHLEKGAIQWNKQTLLGPRHTLISGEKNMKLVSQELDIMPFTSVAANIAEHLNRQNKIIDNNRVDELLEVVDLSAFKNVKVNKLSGGQKQRVAIAKALAKEPEVLLLDEPFSSIDNFLKNKLRRRLFAYLKEKNITCITATHDSEEGLSFADAILMLKDGKQEMYGSPAHIFSNIATAYQGSFFGDVSMICESLLSSTSSTVELCVLPHQLGLTIAPTQLSIIVRNCYYKGYHYLVEGEYDDKILYFNHHTHLINGTTGYIKFLA